MSHTILQPPHNSKGGQCTILLSHFGIKECYIYIWIISAFACAHLVRWNPTSSKDATSMHCEFCHILILVIRTKPHWFIPSLFICHKFQPPIIHKGWGVRWIFYYFGLMLFKLMVVHHTCEFAIFLQCEWSFDYTCF
jgi:hypothetical protein